MPSPKYGDRNQLCSALTARQLMGVPGAKAGVMTFRGNAEKTTSCSGKGLDLSFIATRLEHVAAMKDANPRSRHPLHRFCPQQYPAVIDADFLSLYTRQPRARPPVEKLQQETFDSAFSKLHYRAPSAPASWGDGACIGIKDVVSLPWRPVPRAVSPDNLSLLDDVRCVLLQLFFNGSLFWVPVLLIWVWRRHCKTRRRKVMFALVVLSLVFFPIRPRPAIRKWRGWHKFHRYHRTSVIVEQAHQFPPKEPTIYAVFPHGIVPAAPAVMATGDFGNLLGHFRLTAASIVRRCLIYGQIVFLTDAIPADRPHLAFIEQTLRKSMKESLEKRANLLVSPGGIAEIYETSTTQERLHLKDRLGIVRLAMETGAKLVPVYCFGHSHAYRLAWGARFLQPVARLMRTALVMFYGRFGLPVAFRAPFLYAIGRPLQVPQVDKPSREEVASAHQLLVSEVQRIFDTYKGLYGWGERTLEIL